MQPVQNLNKPCDWTELSKNPNITIEFIKHNINKQWDWAELSKNKNITF